jgi:hypothetical protein
MTPALYAGAAGLVVAGIVTVVRTSPVGSGFTLEYVIFDPVP